LSKSEVILEVRLEISGETSRGTLMAKHDRMPKYHELMNPLLKALHELGGSGSVEEILSQVSDSLGLPEHILAIPHNPDKSSQTELEYRLGWARWNDGMGSLNC
jgi:hypothetical protein